MTFFVTKNMLGPRPNARLKNRVGAGNSIGTEAALNAPADGYTMLLVKTVG